MRTSTPAGGTRPSSHASWPSTASPAPTTSGGCSPAPTSSWAEIANALADQTDYEHHWLINPETGEIAFWTADTGIDGQARVDLDELDPIVIQPLPSWIWYQDMADFADGITDERARRRLARAIQGKGAFRRFKDELHEEHPDLLPAWYAFRDTRASRRAVQWLADNSLIDDGSANSFFSGHPDPALP
jgi:hypothetical protein